jgi:hypothetical protein
MIGEEPPPPPPKPLPRPKPKPVRVLVVAAPPPEPEPAVVDNYDAIIAAKAERQRQVHEALGFSSEPTRLVRTGTSRTLSPAARKAGGRRLDPNIDAFHSLNRRRKVAP